MSAHPYSGSALRRAAWHFLTGKAISGLLTFTILLWLVRLLPVVDYGTYVSLVAAAELAFALGDLGLSWAAARFLPEARLHAQPAVTRNLAWRLIRWQATPLFVIAALAGLTFDVLLPMIGLAVSATTALVWAGLIFAEGVGRFLREAMLSPLLRQESVRTSLVARQTSFIMFLGILSIFDKVSLTAVLAAELVASLIAGLIAVGAMRHNLRSLSQPPIAAAWHSPSAGSIWQIALPMYCGRLLTFAYSPQVFLLLLHRFTGAESAALFGFLRSIFEQASRYLPASLLFSLIRPKLVASYVGGGGMAELSRNSNLAGKLSLFVLMPVVSFSLAGGEVLVSLLSGGKFVDSGLLFFGFMLALVPFSQRQLLETVAVTASCATLCTLGSFIGLLTLPLMLWLLHAGAGPWAGVAALGGGHLLFALVLVSGLNRVGYRSDHVGLARLIFAAIVGAIAATFVPAATSAWLSIAAWAVAAGLVFLLTVWLLGPFAESERRRMNQLLGRRLFHV